MATTIELGFNDGTVDYWYTDDKPITRVVVSGTTVWEAPKPKKRVHPIRHSNLGASQTFWKEDGEYDLYLENSNFEPETGKKFVVAFPATYE